VAYERCEDIGNVVGYNVRLESSSSENTQLMFCTTGVLLRRIVADPMLSGITCVILDEVHERDINTDFLLILIRELAVKRPELKVVVMSATLQVDLLRSYFTEVPALRVSSVHIIGSAYPVTR
jgi:HrpA-like RNA helicase